MRTRVVNDIDGLRLHRCGAVPPGEVTPTVAIGAERLRDLVSVRGTECRRGERVSRAPGRLVDHAVIRAQSPDTHAGDGGRDFVDRAVHAPER